MTDRIRSLMKKNKFDRIYFVCPNCSCDIEIHSVVGKCEQIDYWGYVPSVIAVNIDREKICCTNCATQYMIVARLPNEIEVSLIKVESNKDYKDKKDQDYLSFVCGHCNHIHG